MNFVHEDACGVNDTLSENEAGSGFHGLTREEILSSLVSECNAALFRLLPDGSVPGNPPGVERGEGGFKLATRDLSVIRVWLADPAQQIGVTAYGAQGRTLAVLDIDIGEGKARREEALASWAALKPRLPTNTLVVETPSGGLHVYLMVPEALSNYSPWPGIDVRSGKGFVRAIGDAKRGRMYRVIDPSPIADMPADVLPELETISEQKAAAEAAAAAREAARAAGRDNTVPWSSEAEGKLRAALWKLHPSKLSGSEWHNLAWAIRNTFGGFAYALFDEWSAQDERNYDREENGVKWDRRGEPADSMTMRYATSLWKKHRVAGFIDWGDGCVGSTADDWTGATAISGEGDGADDAIVRELLDLLLWDSAPHVTVFEEPYIAALARIRGRDEAAYQRWRARLEVEAGVSYANRRALDTATKDRAKAAAGAAKEAAEAARGERLRASAERRNRDADEPVVFDTPDECVVWFNKRCAVVNVSGKTVIMYDWRPVYEPASERAAELRFRDKRVLVIDDDGKAKMAAAFDFWTRNPKRRLYDGVAFLPVRYGGNAPEDGAYPLWRGWGAAPAEGSCALFLDHLQNVICGGNPSNYQWLIGWLAHLVQHPNVKPGTAVVLRSDEKGSGKDTVGEYICAMIGSSHSFKLVNQKHLLGQFNSHLAQTLFIHAEEVTWGGDQKADSALKNLITAETIAMEQKYMPVTQVRNYCRLLMTANTQWAVPATRGERRYFVLDVNPRHAKDREYFDALYHEMENGGPAALHRFLLGIDLTGFNVRNPPHTTGLTAQTIEGLRDADRFIYLTLESGDLWRMYGGDDSVAGADETDSTYQDRPVTVSRRQLFDLYGRTAKTSRHGLSPDITQTKLSWAVSTWLPCAKVGKHKGDPPVTFPSLAECRAAFEAVMGGPVDWGD